MEASVVQRCGPVTSDVNEDEFMDVKKGPWTAEEDALLVNYVSMHGEGRWNSVSHFAGLKRTGKSCRLRWLNYLRPDLRRGNMTLQEQLLILELHSRWGNRWSKIAEYLPGRTDNEIKNYWRTRVQKQAKQLKCDVNSKQFRDAMQYIWMPRLRERIQSSSVNNASDEPSEATTYSVDVAPIISNPTCDQIAYQMGQTVGATTFDPSFAYEIPAASSDSYSDTRQASLVSDPCERYDLSDGSCMDSIFYGCCSWPGNSLDYTGDLMMENLWNEENIRFLQQQLFDD